MQSETNDDQFGFRRQDVARSDAWLFGPMLVAVVALPFAIVTMLSVSLWFLAQNADLAVTESMKSPSAITQIRQLPPRPTQLSDG